MIIGHDQYKLNNVVDKELYKMSNIWRYSSRLIQKPENLAEHSFYVAFKVYELGYAYGISEERINKAAKIALCHDCGEIYTGDLPHSLKAYSPDIKRISEELEVKLIGENFKWFGQDFKDFMERKDEVVCCLVEIADIIDVIMFIDREESLGNKDPDILDIRTEITERYVKAIMHFEEVLEAENKPNKKKGEKK